MVERQKELSNVKCNNTCVTLFGPSSTNEVSEE